MAAAVAPFYMAAESGGPARRDVVEGTPLRFCETGSSGPNKVIAMGPDDIGHLEPLTAQGVDPRHSLDSSKSNGLSVESRSSVATWV